MALTIEILNSQEGLSTLSDEQKQLLVGLSVRDEDMVIDRKYGELYGTIDGIIAAESAVRRDEGEKSSDYLTRVLRQMKSVADEADGYKTVNGELNAQIVQLKEGIAKGAGNEALKAELDKLKADLVSSKKVNDQLQESLTKSNQEYAKRLEGYKMESELAAAVGGIAIKKELAEATKQALLTLAMQNVKSSKYVYDETAESFVFQNADGTPMKDNSLNNVSVADMLLRELEGMGVVETMRKVGGAGAHGGAGAAGGNGAGIDVTSARTRMEATETIERQLMSQGHSKSDMDWHQLVRQAYQENREVIEKLPLR